MADPADLNEIFAGAIVAPFVVTGIKSHVAGGYEVKIHFPEIATNHVKQLMGTENKKNYLGAFQGLDEIEQQPRKKPGPKPKEPQEGE